MFLLLPERIRRPIVVVALFGAMNAAAQTYGPEGARAGGLGGAFAAISNDGDGIYYNPAGLIYSPQRLLFSFGVQNLFSSGLPLQNSLSNENALLASHVSVVYNRLVRPNQTLPVLVLAGTPPLGPQPAGRELAPTSNIFSAGVTANFLRTGLLDQFLLAAFFSKGFFEKSEALATANHLPHWLSVSVTAKLTGLQYDSDLVDQAQVNSLEELAIIRDFFDAHGRNQFSAGLDLGLMAAVHPRVQVAFAWSNLLRPNLALEGRVPASRRERLGAAVLLQKSRQWLLSVDAEHDNALQAWRLYAGTETGLLQIAPEVFRLRLGANHNWMAAGFKLAKPTWFELNYAFIFPAFFQDERPAGFFNHRLTLAFSKPMRAGPP
ncbi:MAG: hypothetical protein ACREOO_09695 [bacterium]